MKNRILYFFLLVVFSWSCEENEGCLRGEIFGHNCCVGATTIILDAYIPSSATLKVDGKTRHVIIVPGHVGADGSEIFFRVRKYNAEKDSDLLDGICLCMVPEGEYPTHVITASSSAGCP